MASYTSQNLCICDRLADAMLNSLSARPAAALLPSATVALIDVLGFVPTPGLAWADVSSSECNFDGYAQQALSLTAPVNLSPTCQGGVGNVTFLASGSTTTTHTGATAYVVISGGEVQMSEAFGSAGPYSFGSAGDFLALEVQVPVQSYQAAS